MYTEDDTMTPRDRISDDMLRRMLNDSERSEQMPTVPELPHRTNLHLPDGFPLASVYAPTQMFRKLYDRDTALARGTIFQELDLPFMGISVMKGGNCRG